MALGGAAANLSGDVTSYATAGEILPRYTKQKIWMAAGIKSIRLWPALLMTTSIKLEMLDTRYDNGLHQGNSESAGQVCMHFGDNSVTQVRAD